MNLNFDSNVIKKCRGTLKHDVALACFTWFQVGGNVPLFFRPKDIEDLCFFLKNTKGLPLFYLGAGSNVLIRDGNLEGITVRLGKEFSKMDIIDNLFVCGAGCLDRTVSYHLLENSLSGLEFLVGIPGTIGGAIFMNAGCYGSEIKDTLEWVDIVSRDGQLNRLHRDDLNMSYRKSNLRKDTGILRAAFRLNYDSKNNIQEKIENFLKEKMLSQPLKGRTGGSTFKNPINSPFKAWELIDQAGCRGLKLGGAKVSEKHCNFLLNEGNATALDLECLGECVRTRVFLKSNIELAWEIIRIG
jgi:UDP-N-acetylmuramate dehydrogenase